MNKDNSQVRYIGYAKMEGGEWYAKVYDTAEKKTAYCMPMADLYKPNTKQDALDWACEVAENWEQDADHTAELDASLAMGQGVG